MQESQSQLANLPPDAIESPQCPRCHGQMTLSRLRPRRLNFDACTFECARCDHVETTLVAADPMHSDTRGWLLGELRSPV
jgi:hypothetical protein